MLPKNKRVTKNKEFDLIFKTGRSAYVNLIGVKAVKNKLDKNRLGVLINNKVSKKAVERNRIKRIIKSVFKEKESAFNDRYDILVIALPAIKDSAREPISTAFNDAIKRLRLN